MTRDDIIQMACKAGGGQLSDRQFQLHGLDTITAFATFVAAKAVQETSAEYRMGWNDGQINEREACAQVCEGLLERPSGYQGTWEGYGKFKTQMTGKECALAIRARSQHGNG